MSSQQPALKLLDLIQSHRVTAVIHVAVRLGLAELLRDGPQTVGKLAEATGAEERALGRLLTALSTIGLCARTSENSYALTDVGACLDGASEQSFKAWAILEAEMLTKSWSGMLESVMTGKTAAQLLGHREQLRSDGPNAGQRRQIQCRDDGPDAGCNAGNSAMLRLQRIVPFDGCGRRVR